MRVGFASFLGAPIVVPRHLWRLGSLDTERWRRRDRGLAIGFGVLVGLLIYFWLLTGLWYAFFSTELVPFEVEYRISAASSYAIIVAFPLTALFIQAAQNRIIDRLGADVAFGKDERLSLSASRARSAATLGSVRDSPRGSGDDRGHGLTGVPHASPDPADADPARP